KVVSIMTRNDGSWASASRKASSPSIVGMRMSRSATIGRCLRTSSTASRPSPASATTSMSGSASRIARIPSRTSRWSSASTTVIRIVMRRSVVRKGDEDVSKIHLAPDDTVEARLYRRVRPANDGGGVLTGTVGIVLALIAGLLVTDRRRVTTVVVLPFLAVAGIQTWGIASGRGVSPPSTVAAFPGAIQYYLVQAIILTLALAIACQ